MTSREDKLTVKQQAFISEYTDTDSDTFGNGSRAYKKAYNTDNDSVARVQASKMLARPNIRHRVDKILDSIGYGEKVRLEVLTEIGMGKYVKTTKQTRLDADGNVKDTIVTESTPGADSIVRVNDVINRLTGKYENAKQASRIMSKSMQSMIDRITSQASTPQPIKQAKQVKHSESDT